MKLKTWTKGVLTLFALLFLCAWVFQLDAWARAGGGGSIGQPRLPVHVGPQTLHRAPAHARHRPHPPGPLPRARGSTAPQPARPRVASCGASAAACWAAWLAVCSSAACSAGLRPKALPAPVPPAGAASV